MTEKELVRIRVGRFGVGIIGIKELMQEMAESFANKSNRAIGKPKKPVPQSVNQGDLPSLFKPMFPNLQRPATWCRKLSVSSKKLISW